MAGSIALVGGDEFRSTCEEMDRHILTTIPEEPAKVLIVPTAAASDNPVMAASNGVRYFSSLGATADQLMVVDREQANDEALFSSINDASVIYFTGGNPDHLLTTLRGSKLQQKVMEALSGGCVLAGSSAGAMVLGSAMRRPSGGWVEGLEVAKGVAVLPHHERRNPEEVMRSLAAESVPEGLWVLGIDGATCCFGGPGDWRVLGLGKVTLYQGDRWRSFGPGEKLPEGL